METAARSEEARGSARSPALWAGLVVPPAAWGVQLVLSDLLFEMGCAPGVQGQGLFGVGLATWSLVVSAAAIVTTAAAGLFTYRAWRRLRDVASDATWYDLTLFVSGASDLSSRAVERPKMTFE